MELRIQCSSRLCGPTWLVAAILVWSVSLPGQASWTHLTNSPGMFYHGMVYDAGRDRVVRYGGQPCVGTLGETWEFDGGRWRQVIPLASPPPRQFTTLTYDAHRKRTVLFAGLGQCSCDDLWEWDGTTWTERVSAMRPAPRFGHMLAYDERRRCVVLFGGISAGGVPFDDTWTWDGTTWREHTPATRPPARDRAGLAYDPVRGCCVLFSGTTGPSPADTWEWDGTDWALVAVGGPPGRSDPGFAYDHQRRQMILFGGWNGVFGFGFADTWGWDGQQWTPLADRGPTGRASHGMVYDSRRGRILVHGGTVFTAGSSTCFDDTWVLNSPTPGFAGFGSGCVGTVAATATAVVPSLSLASAPPGAGGVLDLSLTNLATSPTAMGFFVFGASRQQWSSLSLPLPLLTAGLPSCSLWVGMDAVVSAPATAGTANLSLQVPGASTVHVQGLGLDSSGLSLSGAATVDTVP
ncbi:MAG: kelch repeat-containing protein [Planctomycetota bacterium]